MGAQLQGEMASLWVGFQFDKGTKLEFKAFQNLSQE